MTAGATLDVEATLTVERDGTVFDVWTEDDRVVVNAPSLSALRELRSLWNAPLPPGADGGSGIADLPVEVRARHATVARTGAGAAGSPLLTRVAGRDARLDWRGVLAAAVRALG